MIQQWFNLAGLSFDFVGVIMLAYEWWIAHKADEQAAERAAFEQRIRPNPVMQQQMQQNNPHHQMHSYMQDNLRFQRSSTAAQTLRGMRRGWFVAALVLIATGFLLQILGSWPGGI